MPIASEEFRIVFYDVPKVASTSVKTLLWEARHKRKYKRPSSKVRKLVRLGLLPARMDPGTIQGKNEMSVTGFDNIPEQYRDFDKITLIRDPIARLHSAWKNKARRADFERTGAVEALKAQNLSIDPDYSEFVENLDAYRKFAKSVRLHTNGYATLFDRDISVFDRVFTIEKIGEFQDYLGERAGRNIELPHRNVTESETRDSRLSPKQIEKLLAITSPEYEWVGDIYSQEAGLQRFLKKTAA